MFLSVIATNYKSSLYSIHRRLHVKTSDKIMDLKHILIISLYVTTHLIEDSLQYKATTFYNTHLTRLDFPLHNMTLDGAYTTTIHVTSPCCDVIVVENANCDPCTGAAGNETNCFLSGETATFVVNGSDVDECKLSTSIRISCTALTCQGENSTWYNPGDETDCVNGTNARCYGNGTWDDQNCTQDATSPGPLSTKSTSSRESSETTAMSSLVSPVLPTVTTLTITNNISTTVLTRVTATTTEMSTENVTNTSLNETSTDKHMTKDKSLNALYTFLAVLGAVMVLVILFVAGFFVRQSRKVPPDNYSLEYWQERDDADPATDRGFCPKTSFAASSAIDGASYTRRGSFAENDDKNDMVRSKSNVDMPNVATVDYSDIQMSVKNDNSYINYGGSFVGQDGVRIDRETQRESIPIEDRKIRTKYVKSASSYKPSDNGGRKRFRQGVFTKSREPRNVHSETPGEPENREDGGRYVHPVDHIFALCYKTGLRHLDTNSAEESDV